MSVYQNLFIGPFAEWLVPVGKDPGVPRINEDEEPLFYEKLACNIGISGPDTIQVGRKRYHQYCYAPAELAPPGREMRFGGTPAWLPNLDLTGVDHQAEIGWLKKTFAKEFKTLAEHFGVEPTFRWGVLCWPS